MPRMLVDVDCVDCMSIVICALWTLAWSFRIYIAVHWTTAVDVARLQFGIQFGAGLSHMSGSFVVWPLCDRWHRFSFCLFTMTRSTRVSMLWPPLRFSISIVFVKFVYFWRPLGLRFCAGFSCLTLSSLLISTLRKQVSCAQDVVDCFTDTLYVDVCVCVCICRYAQLSPYTALHWVSPMIRNIEINIDSLSTGH